MKKVINNLTWEIAIVPTSNPELIVNECAHAGATWILQQKIFLSADLTKNTAKGIIAHELAHAFLYSTQIKCTQKDGEETYTEEEMCNFIQMWGKQIFALTNEIYNELYCDK